MKYLYFLIFILFTVSIYAQELSVVTYNIKYDNPSDSLNNWNNRKEFLISQLNYNQPGIFGTQEGLYHQLEDIKNGLENHEYFGVGRDFGDNRGEYTAIFYNTKKFKLLKQHTFWLSETPNTPSKGWDAAFKRICTYGEFEVLSTGKRVLVFNTHFDHIGVVARNKSGLLILKKIAKINRNKLPVILMGDFNLESESTGIQNILNHFKDAHFEAGKNAFGPKGTFNGFHFNKPVTRKIDYIFISKKMKVLKSAVLSDSNNCLYPSDHFPVLAKLAFIND